MFTLIKNADVYSPRLPGMNDISLAEDKIVLTDPQMDLTGVPFDTTDAGGCVVTPGFPDHPLQWTNAIARGTTAMKNGKVIKQGRSEV